MNGITENRIDEYIYGLLPARHPVHEEMEQQARVRNIPIVGPAVGRLLWQYARMIGAKKIFELGSAIGYSTLWWAQAAGKTGEIFYTDGDVKKAEEARGYFERAGVLDQIHIEVGDALESLGRQSQQFDVIFNDVDKEYYPEVLGLVAARLRPGGLFITDNVLWSGRVTEAEPKEESTRAIQEFNSRLAALPEFFTTIVPLRDGLSISLKI